MLKLRVLSFRSQDFADEPTMLWTKGLLYKPFTMRLRYNFVVVKPFLDSNKTFNIAVVGQVSRDDHSVEVATLKPTLNLLQVANGVGKTFWWILCRSVRKMQI